jgi:hypothetical protein
MVPTAGISDHVTAAFIVPVTVALNCWVCDARNVAPVGLTTTLTDGCRLTVAVAVLLESAALLAMTVTVCDDVIEAGAV